MNLLPSPRIAVRLNGGPVNAVGLTKEPEGRASLTIALPPIKRETIEEAIARLRSEYALVAVQVEAGELRYEGEFSFAEVEGDPQSTRVELHGVLRPA